MHIIKDGRIVEDAWRHLSDDAEIGDGPVTVTLNRWRRELGALSSREDPLGLRLTGSDNPEEVAGDLAGFSLILLEFTSLRDGRAFSHARMLRERLGYSGEIRARGDFIRDQMFFLSRVGVNAFEFADRNTASAALPSLTDFSVAYQPAAGDRARAANAIGGPLHPRY